MPHKLYKEQIDKIESRIAELKAQNVEDQGKVRIAKKHYENAVNKFDTNKVDELHIRIEKMNSDIENRLKQIAILESKDNPLRVEAKKVLVISLEDEVSEIKTTANELHEKILKAQQVYIDLANEIFEINAEYIVADRSLSRVNGTNPYNKGCLDPGIYEVKLNSVQDGKNERNQPIYKSIFKGAKQS